MKNYKVFFGIAIAAMVVGLALVGCKQTTDSDSWDNQYGAGPNIWKEQKVVYGNAADTDATATVKYEFEGNKYWHAEKVATIWVYDDAGTYTWNNTAGDQRIFKTQKQEMPFAIKNPLAVWDTYIKTAYGDVTTVKLDESVVTAIKKNIDNQKPDAKYALVNIGYEKPLYDWIGKSYANFALWNNGNWTASGISETVFLLGEGYKGKTFSDYWKDWRKKRYESGTTFNVNAAGVLSIN